MSNQYDFKTEDWDELVIAPVVVGLAVAKAEDSGFFGSFKETRTLVSSIAARVPDGPGRALIEAAAAAETKEAAKGLAASGPDVLADAAVSACHRLNDILAANTELAEAADFKAWILDVATAVAEAAKETEVRISTAEAELIERVKAALLDPES